MSQLDHSAGAAAVNLIHQRSQETHVSIGHQPQLPPVPPARWQDVSMLNND
jgi:hypothetical protein